MPQSEARTNLLGGTDMKRSRKRLCTMQHEQGSHSSQVSYQLSSMVYPPTTSPTPGHRREYYLSRRREYEPDVVSLAVVAESPPASGRYFYDPDSATTEPLFAAFMKQLSL